MLRQQGAVLSLRTWHFLPYDRGSVVLLFLHGLLLSLSDGLPAGCPKHSTLPKAVLCNKRGIKCRTWLWWRPSNSDGTNQSRAELDLSHGGRGWEPRFEGKIKKCIKQWPDSHIPDILLLLSFHVFISLSFMEKIISSDSHVSVSRSIFDKPTVWVLEEAIPPSTNKRLALLKTLQLLKKPLVPVTSPGSKQFLWSIIVCFHCVQITPIQKLVKLLPFNFSSTFMMHLHLYAEILQSNLPFQGFTSK